MKWLRAHTKQIMVVVVLLAMVSFVGGTALVSFLEPTWGKELYGRAFGANITQGDMSFARRDLDILENIYWMPPQFKSQYGESWQFGRRDMRIDHWYLLLKEAERAGIVVSDQEVELQLKQFPPETMDLLRTQKGYTPPEIRQAMARQLTIQKNANHVLRSAVPSEAQARHYVLDTEDKIRVRFIAVPAERFLDPLELVSDEELQAQFEANKDVIAADSETGFGYRHPRRVNLQYLIADVNQIAPQMQVSLDAVKSYWKTNKSQFTKTIYIDPEPPATPVEPVEGEPPPEPPAPQPKLVEKTFSEAQPDIKRELRRRNARQVAEQAIKKAHTILARPWQDVRTDPETGFKPIPPSQDDPGLMKSVGDRVSAEFSIPIRFGETGLITEDALITFFDLRGAAIPGGTAQSTLASVAFRVPTFLSLEDVRDDAGFHLQLFQPSDAPYIGSDSQLIGGPIQTVENRIIVFRVVEAHASEPPAHYSEVRDKVERDVRLARAFERAEPTAREIYAIAARVGVERTMDLLPDLKTGTPAILATSPPAFARRSRLPDFQIQQALEQNKPTLTAPNLIGVGASETFVDACFEMTQAGWSPPEMEIPETERVLAAMGEPEAEPAPLVRLISLPKVRKHFVVEFVGSEPVDQERFESELRQTAYYRLMSERSSLLRTKWFDPSEIEKRAEFEKAEERALPEGYDGIQLPARPAPPMF